VIKNEHRSSLNSIISKSENDSETDEFTLKEIKIRKYLYFLAVVSFVVYISHYIYWMVKNLQLCLSTSIEYNPHLLSLMLVMGDIKGFNIISGFIIYVILYSPFVVIFAMMM
jgi:hypothetical protein